MEEWRDIKGFPGYQVSDYGNVRSCINNRHGLGDTYHFLKPIPNARGYLTVQLGHGNRWLIHRLVAMAFIPNPHNYPFVRHMDDDPTNNYVGNLAWGTQTDNMQDCVRHGRLVGDTRAAINARKKSVIATSRETGERMIFPSIQEAGRVLHVWPQHICNNIFGKISQTGGYTFEYADGRELIDECY